LRESVKKFSADRYEVLSTYWLSVAKFYLLLVKTASQAASLLCCTRGRFRQHLSIKGTVTLVDCEFEIRLC